MDGRNQVVYHSPVKAEAWPIFILFCGVPPFGRERAEEEAKNQKRAIAALSHRAASSRGMVLAARLSRSGAKDVPHVERSEPLRGDKASDEGV